MPKPEQRLLTIHAQLDDANRDSLLSFAEFLLSKQPAEAPVAPPGNEPLPEPLLIPRPDNESVVAAIRRLRETYPMIERSAVFQPSSTLMTQHILEGREVSIVIDELEELFSSEYAKLSSTSDEQC